MTYKILENIISASVSEARNAPAAAATIVVAGTVDVTHGETVVISHEQGGKRSYYPVQAIKIDYEKGNTTITGRSLLSQLFNCILPDMADQAGEASVIIQAVLTALNAAGFADVYINPDNFVASSRQYATVNVSHRKVGELLQDLCKDTQFVMWIGYDEVNDKFNAFFFKPFSSISQDLGAVKEGANIVSETVQMGSLDDICNYVLMYYFPKRYPYAEDWTEPAFIEAGTAARTWYADYATQAKLPGATREVRLFQAGPVTTLTSDCTNEDHLHVGSTDGFEPTGLLLIDGAFLVYYLSKTASTFVLPGAINGKWSDGAIICQGWMSDGDYEATCEAVSVMMAPITDTVDQLDFYIESIVGTPGPIKVYAVSSEYGFPMQLIGTITPTIAGWQTLSLSATFGSDYFYSLRLVFLIEQVHTVNDYYTLGMGPSAVGDFWYWSALGSEVWGTVADNLQMLSWGMFSGLMTAPNTTWICTGTVKALDQAAFLSAGGMVMNDNRAGKGCIRFIGAGTAKVVDGSDISEYDRLHFYFKGNMGQVEIECVGGSYFQALSSASDWQEETLTLSAMLTSGTPLDTLIDIKFTITGGSAWVDGLYFLAPTSGLPVTVQDDDSIALYGQHPEVIYATGVTESSYAYSLAQAIVADKKVPKYAGSIIVKDVPARWTPQRSVRVIIPSKSIDEVMDIYQVTHTMDRHATLEVNSFEFDYSRVLAGLQSGVENLQISFGATPQVDENVALQVPASTAHAARHAHGGTDEINVGGLSGALTDNQPTTWVLVALKPSSAVADIDQAVSWRHQNVLIAHTHPESEVTDLTTHLGAKIPKSILTAKGSIIVASDVGTPAELLVGDEHEVPTAQADGSVAWELPAGGGGSGDVVGPEGATPGNLAVFADETGKVLEDGGAPGAGAGDVTGPEGAADGDIPQFDTTTGKLLKDGLAVVTIVGDPGSDTALPTEQAVREAIDAGGGGGLANPLTADLDADNHDLTLVKLLTLHGEIDDGNSSTADTIDWNTGAAHKSTLTDNVTFAFTGYGATVVPTMTSETAPSGVVTKSSEYNSTYAAWKAFDNNEATSWAADGALPQWLGYQFTEAKTIRYYGLKGMQYGGNPITAGAWVLEGWNGVGDWVTVDSRTGASPNMSGITYYSVATPGAYAYYRLTITAGAGSYLQMVGLVLLETATSNPPAPCFLTLKLVQDGTGGRTVTWPATVKGTVTLDAAASATTIVQFYWDGTYYWVVRVATF